MYVVGVSLEKEENLDWMLSTIISHINIAKGLAVVLQESLLSVWRKVWKTQMLTYWVCFSWCDVLHEKLGFNKKKEWVMGMKFKVRNFLNSTNNRFESLNGK